MTSTHSSRAHLKLLPLNLRELYFPPSCRPEKFIEGWALEEVSRAAWNNSVETFNLYELMDEQYHKDIAARDAAAATPGRPTEREDESLQPIQQPKERGDKGDKLEQIRLQKIKGEPELLKQPEEAKK
ncbi:hypothetical protein FRC06_004056 [Ceratobasidium sp. 370]|nr:hypothetical protein FRC06_004056 [Ceratobasidium sp. 370]